MVIEVLDKELKTLSEDKLQKVYEYVISLKSTPVIKKRQIGTLSDDFISIADDVDDIPEGMEEFV